MIWKWDVKSFKLSLSSFNAELKLNSEFNEQPYHCLLAEYTEPLKFTGKVLKMIQKKKHLI